MNNGATKMMDEEEKEIGEGADDGIGEIRFSAGAEIYNIAHKCGINVNPGVFKDFEARTVRYIFETMGAVPPEEDCNFESLMQSFMEASTLVKYLFNENKKLGAALKEHGIELADGNEALFGAEQGADQ